MEISIGGSDVLEIVSMVSGAGACILLASLLWGKRDAIKSALSKAASKVKQASPDAVATHSCEQFNASSLDLVALCIGKGDDEGAAMVIDLMKKHNVAEAMKNQPCKSGPAPISTEATEQVAST